MNKLDLLLEAEKRGLPIPEDKRPLLEEARKRGLVPEAGAAKPGLLQTAAGAARDVLGTVGIELPGGESATKGNVRAVGEAGKAVVDALGTAQGLAGKAAEVALGPGPAKTLMAEPNMLAEAAKLGIPQSELDTYLLGLQGPIGEHVAGLWGRFAEATAPKLTHAGEALVELARRYNVPLSAADASRSKTVAQLESLLEKTPFGAGPIQDFRKKQLEALYALKNSISEKLGGDAGRAAVGHVWRQAAVDASEAADTGAKALYAEMSRVAGDRAAEVPRYTQVLEGRLKQELQRRAEDQNSKIIGWLQDELEALRPREVPNPLAGSGAPPPTPEAPSLRIGDFNNKRARLNELIGEEMAITSKGRFQATRFGAVLSEAKAALGKDLTGFAEAQGGEIKRAYDAANAFYGQQAEVYKARAVRRLLDQKVPAEDIVPYVFRPGEVANIELVKKAAGQQAFEQLRRPWVEQLLGALGPEEKFNPAAFQRILGRYGKETLEAAFRPEELKGLLDLAKLSDSILTAEKLAGNPSGTARGLIGATAWGSLAKALWSHNPVAVAGAAAGIGATRPLAQLYLSPGGRKLILEGVRIPAGTPQAQRYIARTSAILGSKAFQKYMGEEKR